MPARHALVLVLFLLGCGTRHDGGSEPAATSVVELPALPAASASAAVPAQPPPGPALPKCCADFEQIKALDGQRVVLEGKYSRVAIQKRRFSDEEKRREADRVAKTVQIRTGDTSVMLEVYYRPEGTRSDAELEKLDQKRVRVVGKLIKGPPPQMHGDIPMQTMINPCIVDIESIELLE